MKSEKGLITCQYKSSVLIGSNYFDLEDPSKSDLAKSVTDKAAGVDDFFAEPKLIDVAPRAVGVRGFLASSNWMRLAR